MRFLCVPCDKPMQLLGQAVDQGSVSLTYSCPDCGYEFAMLTNPMETQLVTSLGVKLGGDAAEGSGSKCPFTGMVRQMAVEASEPGALAWTAEAERRMANLPEFVKPMVRTGIERFARDKGYAAIDERVLDEARGFFGME